MKVFLDTGAIYALADRNDVDHAAVKAAYGDSGREFVTHELVLVEAFSLLTKRLHKSAALLTIGALRRSPRVEVAPLAGLIDRAWARCERFADKEWDWDRLRELRVDGAAWAARGAGARSPFRAGGIHPARVTLHCTTSASR